MSATFNWSIKPGVTNRYGITIPSTADDVRPSGYAYVALWGNDITGNGSRKYPYRTTVKANTLGSIWAIVGAGTYRNYKSASLGQYADGDVIIDNSVLTPDPGGVSARMGGFKWTEGASSMSLYSPNKFSNITTLSVIMGGEISNSIVKSSSFLENGLNPSLSPQGNNTFINVQDFKVPGNSSSYYYANNLYFSIFLGCKISFYNKPLIFDYSLFYNCQFRLGSSGAYTTINDLPTLIAFITATYPDYTGLQNCAFGDPKFNNTAIGDYTLAFDSPAKNRSYLGTYVGAKSIAYAIKAKATESLGNFEFASAINLTIADESITLTNPASDGQVDTKVIVNSLARELVSFPSYGFNADRNGQYIDSIADLDTVTKTPSDTLLVGYPYLVEVGAIVYNGATYQPGDRFTTVAGVTSFTTLASGVVLEILEAPQRHTIMARFSDGGATITAGDALVVNNYYYVVSGMVIYDSVDYNEGEVFKAVDTSAFSGSGVVMLAFSIEAFQHYEPGIKPTSNNAGNLRTGSIVRGNGDPDYDRGGLGVTEFPINAKFIQIRYYFRVSNLKP